MGLVDAMCAMVIAGGTLLVRVLALLPLLIQLDFDWLSDHLVLKWAIYRPKIFFFEHKLEEEEVLLQLPRVLGKVVAQLMVV